jgi:dCTP deaminase
MSDKEIHTAVCGGLLEIIPEPERINPAGIDLRAIKKLTIKPGHQILAATMEKVGLPNNFLGILHLRSSFAREGVIASVALVDPGYQGQLTISLYNAGARRVIIKEAERFVQLTLFRLGKPAKRSYTGQYQNSSGVVKSRRRR